MSGEPELMLCYTTYDFVLSRPRPLRAAAVGSQQAWNRKLSARKLLLLGLILCIRLVPALL